jgi:signal transduction histidine kinase/ActR/RegA family two-component response regulator
LDNATTVLDLVVQMSALKTRAAAAEALAEQLGVKRLLLLVRDPELDVLVPARGFPQTLRAGAAWRSLLARCATPGRYRDEVDLPKGTIQPAIALAVPRAVLVAVGGIPNDSELMLLERLLPMLAATLSAEQCASAAAAEVAQATDTARRAHALAAALDAARAEGAALNAALREEHRRKDEFLAMLAHELRNPLAPLATAIQVLRRAPDDEVIQRQVGVMDRQVGQLSRLVDDLLDLARVSQGRIELRRENLELSDVLTDALETNSTLIDARRHEIVSSLHEEPLWVHADSVRLTQVFANIIHNAAKYTDPGGRIAVSTTREGDEAIVKVSDTGVGIAREMLPHVFDLFVQAPVSYDRSQGGLGIGLTLARTLVELHGGCIWVESDGLTRGSTFVVRLPLAVTACPALSSAMPETKPRVATHGLRVLIVDDNADAADSLGEMLRLLGHQADIAYSGLQALQIAEDADPQLIFLDIGLPKLDGYEVARRLRRTLTRTVRLVALTGYGSDDAKRLSTEAGFDEHVVKPLNLETIQLVLSRVTQGIYQEVGTLD